MKDFYEAVLRLKVPISLAGAYKKAIEEENSRHWVRNEVKNARGEIIQDEIKPLWNGNHVHVEGVDGEKETLLTIGMVSHTLPNLKSTVDWYEKMGAEVVYKSWE